MYTIICNAKLISDSQLIIILYWALLRILETPKFLKEHC